MNTKNELLIPEEIDNWLRFPRGRALRLARRGLLPAVMLPNGEIRFNRSDIEALLNKTEPFRRPGEEVTDASQ